MTPTGLSSDHGPDTEPSLIVGFDYGFDPLATADVVRVVLSAGFSRRATRRPGVGEGRELDHVTVLVDELFDAAFLFREDHPAAGSSDLLTA